MSRFRRLIPFVLVIALCVVAGASSLAFADPLSATGPVPGTKELRGRGVPWFAKPFVKNREDRGPNPIAVLAYIAGKTGVSIDTLYEEFKGGTTLEEIAEKYGVDWSEIEALFKRGELNKEEVIKRLEERIVRLTEAKARAEESIAKMSERISNLEERISEIEDETLRSFAERHLEIMKKELSLANQRLEIIEMQLELAQDELDYAKSR